MSAFQKLRLLPTWSRPSWSSGPAISERISSGALSGHGLSQWEKGEEIVLTILEIRGTRERTALDEGKFDLLKGLALDAGSFGEPVLGLLENLTLLVISKEQS